MLLEFFIEPPGTGDRYELNGWPAADAFDRVSRWISEDPARGQFTPATLDAPAVPTAIVREAIWDVGGTWWKGTRKQAAKGVEVDLGEVLAAIEQHETLAVLFFEM